MALTTTSVASPRDGDPVARGREPDDLELVEQLDRAVGDETVDPAAERGAIGQLVVLRRRHAHGARGADEPRDARARLPPGELGEGEQRVRGGVAGPDDRRVPAGETRAVRPEHVGQGVGHPVSDLVEAEGIESARAEAAGGAVGARRVDDGAGGDILDTRRRAEAERERRRGPPGRAGAVPALAAHGGDGRAGQEAARDRVEPGERHEVLSDEVGSGRHAIGVGMPPARRLEQSPGGRVDEVPPRREQPGVSPAADAVGDAVARLVDAEVEAALDEVRGGGETDRPGPDDRDREAGQAIGASRRRGQIHERHAVLLYIEGCRCSVWPAISMIVNIR